MATMLLLCMIWGGQQITLKLSAPDITPTFQIGLRSLFAAVLVGLVMYFRREVFITVSTWRAGLWAGFFFGLEFLLVGEALHYTTASHTVVFLYTAPIFVALALHWYIPTERLHPLQWLGISCAFVGLALAFLGKSSPNTSAQLPYQLWGDLLALGSGLSWAATTVTIRCSVLAQAPTTQTLQYQLIISAIMILSMAGLLGQWHFNPSPIAISSLLFQVIIVSFFSYLAWFALLKKYIVSQLGVFSFMTPLFGVIAGVLILNEPLEANFIFGALLVIIGILLVSGKNWLLTQWAKQ
ncbi:DMT family transporter [Thiofilum flexile]|uniref:DMT family transporter n=1 Tax=Thiofilum flexile TaxID=125627 RepID=UPI001FDFFF09|nr:DMT family transporter [Thiofilum flexile]